MKAIILAAGKGTRLNKYTKDVPKCMLEFGGLTLLDRQLMCLKKCGIDDIIVVKGYRGELIDYKDVKYYINHEYSNTNMLYSLLCARQEFTDDFIVCYSDILYEPYLIEALLNSTADFGVACDIAWRDYWRQRYGTLDFDIESFSYDSNYNITAIGDPDCNLFSIDARYIGLLKFSRLGIEIVEKIVSQNKNDHQWKALEKPIEKAYMTDLLRALVENGFSVKAIPVEKGWLEFDTNEDYEKANLWLQNNTITNFMKL